MRIKIKYFGMIAEATAKSEEFVEVDDAIAIVDLKQLLIDKYKLASIESLQVAVNQELGYDGRLQTGDELAFLPAFAGG
ncbi:MoaD/ThiS family protein [Flavobacterium frigidarium]|jgi:molybdopterin converting factor small subunit|uniref:MoaD/ThiS family protein n=1 Tax=Flavobacterium frigidarium TaxID=99286 RepID=UPI0030DBEDF6|tara:strand:- start:5540 stop:5776 length:237 start_codon:yes stop_codon:yes gene_type:complete